MIIQFLFKKQENLCTLREALQ